MPSYIVTNTKGRTKKKEQVSQDAADYAMNVAQNDLRTERIKTLNKAGTMERALIDHICDIVQEEIVDPKTQGKKPTMWLDRMDFVLRQLRTAQGKANEYMGWEMDEDSPLDSMLTRQWYIEPITKQNVVDV